KDAVSTMGIPGASSKSTKDSAKSCFVISVDTDGKLEIRPQRTGKSKLSLDPKGIRTRVRSGNCLPAREGKLKVTKKKPLCVSLLRSKKVDRKPDIPSVEQRPEGDTKDALVPKLDEREKVDISPHFVKICNEDLARRPSFVIVDDALARNRLKLAQDQTKEEPYHLPVPMQESPEIPETPVNTGTTQQEIPQNNSSINNNLNEELPSESNGVPSPRKLSQYTADQVRRRLQNVTPLGPNVRYVAGTSCVDSLNQNPEPQHPQAPHVTISFIPMNQRGARSATVMCPCQQFLSAAPGNIPSCCSCSSCNCCLSRTPTSMGGGCNQCGFLGPQVPQQSQQQLDLGHRCYGNSNCYPFRQPLISGYNCSCPSCTSCPSCSSCPFCSMTNLQPPQTVGFGPPGQNFGQPMFPTIHPSSSFSKIPLPQHQAIPVAGGFHPGMGHYAFPTVQPSCCQCPHCRMHQHHYPCCQCFYNNGQQPQCVPPPVPRKPKVVRIPQAANVGGLKRIFTKVSEPSEAQDPVSGNVQERTASTGKLAQLPLVRQVGGGNPPNSKTDSNALYVARFGRTCLILRPTGANPTIPRLLTKRISRYTSVMAYPT
ncbi:hypothetical protein KR018_001534, partial [Drosophila ironensis]